MSDDMPMPDVQYFIAHVPQDTKGLLIIKMTGDMPTQEFFQAFTEYMSRTLKEANIMCSLVAFSIDEECDLTMQLLSDDQLREIGFQRIPTGVDRLN